VAELDEDALVLVAVDVDLGHARAPSGGADGNLRTPS
jgi:hypothetical protein